MRKKIIKVFAVRRQIGAGASWSFQCLHHPRPVRAKSQVAHTLTSLPPCHLVCVHRPLCKLIRPAKTLAACFCLVPEWALSTVHLQLSAWCTPATRSPDWRLPDSTAAPPKPPSSYKRALPPRPFLSLQATSAPVHEPIFLAHCAQSVTIAPARAHHLHLPLTHPSTLSI